MATNLIFPLRGVDSIVSIGKANAFVTKGIFIYTSPPLPASFSSSCVSNEKSPEKSGTSKI